MRVVRVVINNRPHGPVQKLYTVVRMCVCVSVWVGGGWLALSWLSDCKHPFASGLRKSTRSNVVCCVVLC
jgi:hypothetical protein